MSRPVVEFWYEFASTYSWLSVMRIEPLAEAAGGQLEWRPFLLGPVFMALGWNDSPFNIYPPKGRYMWRDLERLAAKYGQPFRRPAVILSGYISPVENAVTTSVKPEERRKSIYRSVLYEAQVSGKARFEISRVCGGSTIHHTIPNRG